MGFVRIPNPFLYLGQKTTFFVFLRDGERNWRSNCLGVNRMRYFEEGETLNLQIWRCIIDSLELSGKFPGPKWNVTLDWGRLCHRRVTPSKNGIQINSFLCDCYENILKVLYQPSLPTHLQNQDTSTGIHRWLPVVSRTSLQ